MQTYPTAPSSLNRRGFLKPIGLGVAALWFRPGLMAEVLATPYLTEGPFYPNPLPLDTDNDLLVLGDALTPAIGMVVELSGRVLDSRGDPVRGALVEIWQCDNNGVYLHPGSDNHGERDKAFQGYGKFESAKDGRYRFRTIRPVPYPGRTPHIHFAISVAGRRLLTTQMFVGGHEMNDRDLLYRRLSAKQRKLVTGIFEPIPDAAVASERVEFDVYLGITPEDSSHA